MAADGELARLEGLPGGEILGARVAVDGEKAAPSRPGDEDGGGGHQRLGVAATVGYGKP
jgi:hypothetical protein